MDIVSCNFDIYEVEGILHDLLPFDSITTNGYIVLFRPTEVNSSLISMSVGFYKVYNIVYIRLSGYQFSVGGAIRHALRGKACNLKAAGLMNPQNVTIPMITHTMLVM